eukprot:jgi/Ulvmu1/11923/UM082_0001.1
MSRHSVDHCKKLNMHRSAQANLDHTCQRQRVLLRGRGHTQDHARATARAVARAYARAVVDVTVDCQAY